MKMPVRYSLIIVAFMAMMTAAIAQNAVQDVYGVYVKQDFQSWSGCSGSNPDPTFSSAKITVENSPFPFPLTKANEFSYQSMNGFTSGTKAYVEFHAGYIKHYKDYEDNFVLNIGKNELVHSADSPCSDNFNWGGNREGYTTTTTVVIDDPVKIKESTKSTYDADDEYCELEFENFYKHSIDQEIVLQMFVNTEKIVWQNITEGQWIPLPNKIISGKKTYVSYHSIAGSRTDPESNYYNYLGKSIVFRVVKTLADGNKTFGNVIADVKFTAKGPKFRVKEVKRSSCNDMPTVYVELQDQSDDVCMNDKNFKWLAALFDESGKKIRFGYFNGDEDGSYYRLIPRPDYDSEIFKNPGEWKLQLQTLDNQDVNFTEETFTIPEKSSAIKVEQGSALYPASSSQYHLLSAIEPYAVINITDDEARLPYAIYKKEGGIWVFVDSLFSLPTNFNSLSETVRLSKFKDFKDSINTFEKGKRNSNWGKYFDMRFNDWFFENQKPAITTETSTIYKTGCVPTSNPTLYVLSENSEYLAYISHYSIASNSSVATRTLLYPSTTYANKFNTFWKSYANTNVYKLDAGVSSSGKYDSGSNNYFALSVDNSGKSTGSIPNGAPISMSKSDQGTYTVLNYNGCSICGRSAADDEVYLLGMMGSQLGISKILTDYSSGILDGTGTKCAYTNEGGSKLYYFEHPTNKIRSWSGNMINTIRYISTGKTPNYIIYENGNKEKYRQYILDDDNKSTIADYFFKTEALYAAWYNDYLAEQWQLYLTKNYGYRLYNKTVVNPAAKEDYVLKATDGCSYDFQIEVKVPKQPVFTEISRTNPNTNCSDDGTITLKCTSGALPLSYSGGTVANTDASFTVSNLKWTDTIKFYNSDLDLSYYFPVNFTGNPNGIQSVTPTAQTCGSTPNGTVTVNFGINSTSKKVYRLTDINGKSIKSENTTDNTCTFKELNSQTQYKVFVDVDGCTLSWPTIVNVENKVFSITVNKTDADEIGGNGKATITVSNLPGSNVTWTGDAFKQGITDNVYLVGSHSIIASHNGCQVKSSFKIEEPQFSGNIGILKTDGALVATLSNVKINALVRSCSFRIVDISSPATIYHFDDQLPIDKVYAIYFNYDGKVKEIYSFSAGSFSDLSTNHTIQPGVQPCFGDEVDVTIVPVDAANVLLASFEGEYTNDLKCKTAESAISYSVRASKTVDEVVSTSLLKVTKILQADKTFAIPQTTKVSAKIRGQAISCYDAKDGRIMISDLSGGYGKYQYKFSDLPGDWVGITQTTEVKIQNKGVYTVLLRDGNCPQVSLGKVSIDEPSPITVADISQINPICDDGANGSFSVKVTGGNSGGYYYCYGKSGSTGWDNFPDTEGDFESQKTDEGTAFNPKSLEAGRYEWKVYDGSKCSLKQVIELPLYINPTINLQPAIQDVKCFDEANGEIHVVGTKGTSDIKLYKWSSVNNPGSDDNETGIFTGLKADKYKLLIIDNQECESKPLQVSIHQPTAPLSVDFAPTTPVSAKYSATGVIHAQILGGNAGTKTVWLQNNRGATVDSINANEGWALRLDSLYAGKYMLRAIDVNGCSYQSDSLEVIEPEKALSFEVIEREDALCKAPTGRFKVQAIGGWEGIYRYKLSAGSSYGTMQSQDGLRAGSYQVSVKDKMGAEFTDAVIIYEPRDSLMVKLKDQTLPTCANNGALTVDVTGGTAPYRLVFDSQKDTTHLAEPQSTSFLNRPAGAYVLKTIDGNGCRFDMDTTLDNTQMLRILSLDPIYPSPSGGTCGLYANTRGGALPLQYEWRNSSGVVMQQNQTLADVPTGLYSLKVTDALNCSQISNGYLPSLADLPLTIKEKQGETKFNQKDGYIILESPLNSFKIVEWMDPIGVSHTFNLPTTSSQLSVSNNQLTISGLMGGAYTVVVTDDKGQKAYVSFNIDAYQKFDFLKKVTISHVQQPGETNGTITAEVTGGVAPYRFTWFKPDVPDASLDGSSDGSRGTLTGIGKGRYRVEVLDTYNNVISQEVEVLEPASTLTLQVEKYSHASCRDTVDAWVELRATGGWGDYQFRHDDEKYYSNSSSRQKLVVRTHDFYLVDRLGVETRVSHLVTEPEYLRARVSLIDSVNCHGNSDGNIFFDITGGTAPYKFVYDSIPNGWIHDTVARNQPARDYRFFLSDSHDCVSLDTLTAQLRQPDELLFSLQDVTHTTCKEDNGKIKVALKGGTRPYRYQWTNFDNQTVGNDSTISDLKQNGLYHLEVLDKNNCGQQFTQTINPSTLPEVTTVSTTDVICYGEATGTATVTGVVPAVPYAPYSFKWSNDSTGTSANGFYAGINHVVITDTNQCTTTKYFEVATPDTLSLRVAAFKDAHCFGYNDGYVEVEPRGGVGGYRYAWSNGETLPRASNLIKGDYLLTLTDGNDCVITHNYTIDEPEKLLVDLGDDIRICPGNSFRLDGQAFTTHQWANYTGVISHERFVSVNDECDYYLQVTNAIGCFAHDTINLSIGNDALQADFLMTSEAPKNDTLMIFELSNLELDSLRWEYEPEAFNDITGATAADYILNLKTLKNGIYNVTLWAYSGGCVANAVKQVEIIDGNDSIPSDGILGYKDPLIKSMVVAPNPNDGKFTLNIELREEADINVVVYSVDHGVKIDTRSDKNLRKYELNYQLGGLNTGVYVIMLTAENERRQVKMVIK